MEISYMSSQTSIRSKNTKNAHHSFPLPAVSHGNVFCVGMFSIVASNKFQHQSAQHQHPLPILPNETAPFTILPTFQWSLVAAAFPPEKSNLIVALQVAVSFEAVRFCTSVYSRVACERYAIGVYVLSGTDSIYFYISTKYLSYQPSILFASTNQPH